MTTKVLATATLQKGTVIRKRIGGFQLFIFIALHVPLALLMREFPLAGTMHALATIAAGIVFATTRRAMDCNYAFRVELFHGIKQRFNRIRFIRVVNNHKKCLTLVNQLKSTSKRCQFLGRFKDIRKGEA